MLWGSLDRPNRLKQNQYQCFPRTPCLSTTFIISMPTESPCKYQSLHCLTTWSRYSLEKLTVPQTVKILFLFHGIWSFYQRLHNLEPEEYSRRLPNFILYIQLQYFPVYFKAFQMVYFSQSCLSKFCNHFSFRPHTPHSPPISSSSISLPENYLVIFAPHLAVFCSLLPISFRTYKHLPQHHFWNILGHCFTPM